jgi:phosphatidylserine/phosphatidylglycerophosphate/cardiolipin synthase-like enzyme
MRSVKRLVSAVIAASLAASPVFAACPNASVDVCFRPGQMSCEAQVVKAIDGAKASLLVQAYSFTDTAIIHAIGEAQKRGVQVRAILDKENRQPRYTGATYLRNADIPVRIDDRVAIAHNKVMVIDGETTIGGSYNYTKSAEGKNAENVTFTKSVCVAKLYRDNFERRWTASAPVS